MDDKGNKLIRQTDGQLGATVNDPDIYRVGEGGVPVFVNPDTGKPFTGDDPRGQAQAWCDRYNNELKDTFNKWADARNTELLAAVQPAIDTIEFAPIYNKLDPVRKTMFEALLDGHEVTDEDGDIIGYDVDLNATLERVNKQVEAIKAQQAAPVVEPTSPALDMPNSGAGTRDGKEIKNVADAMEALEDAKLENARKKG